MKIASVRALRLSLKKLRFSLLNFSMFLSSSSVNASVYDLTWKLMEIGLRGIVMYVHNVLINIFCKILMNTIKAQ